MKSGGTKNLLVSIVLVMVLILNSVATADDNSSTSHGIPSGTWSSSRSRTSSVSSRDGPGLPGQWSLSYNPQSERHSYDTNNPHVDDIINSAPVHIKVDSKDSNKEYSGHGIPFGTWSTSTDEISSASTRIAPGSVGQWSPYSSPPSYEESLATHQPTPRNLEASQTVTSSASGTSLTASTTHQTRASSDSTVRATLAHSTGPARSSTSIHRASTGKSTAGHSSAGASAAVHAGSATAHSNLNATAAFRAGSFEPVAHHAAVVEPVVHRPGFAEPMAYQTAVVEPFHQGALVEEVLPSHYRNSMAYERPGAIVEEVAVAPVRIERPYILEERAVFEDVVIEHDSPIVEFQRHLPTTENQKFINEYNKKKYPGLIFGVDEEIEIEKCFHQAIDYYQDAQVEEIYEDGVIQSPFGSKHVRSPSFSHVNRPARQHEEVLEKCVHKTIIAPTSENGVRIPQVRYLNLTQIKTGTFEWPVVRKAQVLARKTVEKTVTIPQVGFVDLCQDHPTNEHSVIIPQVHTVLVEQIVHTDECEVSIPQVHKIWIPIMGDVTVDQYPTKTRRVSLKQEWDCTIRCEDTRVHFIKIPQRDEGISGTVIKNPYNEGKNICHNCHTSKCAGVGPSLNPFLINEHRDTTPAAAPVVVQAPAPEPEVRVETKYVEVIKEVPIPCPEPEPQVVIAPTPAPVEAPAPAPEPEVKVVTETVYVEVPAPVAEPQVIYQKQEPTEIHHIKLGQCPCSETIVANPVSFAEGAPGAPIQFLQGGAAEASGGFPWWLIPLLLFLPLLLAMLLAWLLCRGRNRKEIVAAAPVEQDSPKKKFVIAKTTREEAEEEIEREIARQLEARAHGKGNAAAVGGGHIAGAEERKIENAHQVQAIQEARGSQEANVAGEQRVIQQETSIVTKNVKSAHDAKIGHVGAESTAVAAIGGARAGGVIEEGKAASAGSPGTRIKQQRPESPGSSRGSRGRDRSSRGSGSSKKVVKKRIVKMMKQGKLVAEKEEILDAEGNVIRTEIRKEGFTSGSPDRASS
ncbi:unnamed protein product [Moneuplotes crassus]|uniref:Uncharacterized protein n=1 Tax=Euplotes crassus TaxID=5936 RepID=A0AAD1XV85_EUPCR|nr:unnamed protein product [Moneuplotes crassus]